jgi:hypothetical protein
MANTLLHVFQKMFSKSTKMSAYLDNRFTPTESRRLKQRWQIHVMYANILSTNFQLILYLRSCKRILKLLGPKMSNPHLLKNDQTFI